MTITIGKRLAKKQAESLTPLHSVDPDCLAHLQYSANSISNINVKESTMQDHQRRKVHIHINSNIFRREGGGTYDGRSPVLSMREGSKAWKRIHADAMKVASASINQTLEASLHDQVSATDLTFYREKCAEGKDFDNARRWIATHFNVGLCGHIQPCNSHGVLGKIFEESFNDANILLYVLSDEKTEGSRHYGYENVVEKQTFGNVCEKCLQILHDYKSLNAMLALGE